jgi:hypothetical protein
MPRTGRKESPREPRGTPKCIVGSIKAWFRAFAGKTGWARPKHIRSAGGIAAIGAVDLHRRGAGPTPAPAVPVKVIAARPRIEALVWELKLRRPELFPENAAPSKGAVALISEWDMLYGRAIPHSFEKAFVNQGGNRERLLIVARQSLVVIFAISFGVLLTSTFLIRRSADYARQSATMWLGKLLFDERLHHGESFSVEGMLAAAAKFDEKNVGGFAFSGRN